MINGKTKSKVKARGFIAKPGAAQAPPVMVSPPLAWLVNRLQVDEENQPLMEGIFSNYNDDIVLEADPNTLVGRYDPARGPAQALVIGDGLRIEDGVLIGEGGGEKGDPGPMGPVGPMGPEGPAGASSSMWMYRFDSNTSAQDPGAGRIRLNNVNPTLATRLYFDRLTQDGLDPTVAFTASQFDDEFVIQERGLSYRNQVFKLLGPAINRTDWFEVPIQWVAQDGANFTNNLEVTVILRSRGQPGPVGPQGPQGLTGNQGPVGNTGPQGPQGPTGPVGGTGPQGAKGDTGSQGLIGPKGDQGVQGVKGDTGNQGPQGVKGDQGDLGPRGEVGPQGPQGEQGIEGPMGGSGDFVLRTGSVMTGPLTLSDDPVDDMHAVTKQYVDESAGKTFIADAPPEADSGEFWWESDSGVLWLRYFDGFSEQWVQVGSSGVGAPGPIGPQGIQGPIGLTGPQGEPGFQGPQGPQGIQGVKGDTGEQGIQGTPGSAKVTISDTAPTPATHGDMWWESDSGLMYVFYADGTSSQWVLAVPQIDISAAVMQTPQTIAPAQQVQARTNIAAAPFDAMAFSGMQSNGGMEVAQFSTPGTGYIFDGFFVGIVGTSVISGSRVSDPSSVIPGMMAYAQITVSTPVPTLSAGEIVQLVHRIEGHRTARVAWGLSWAQPITISFWSAHARPGLYSICIRNAANDRSYVTTYTQNVATTAEYKVITIPGCTDGTWLKDNSGNGIIVSFPMAIGSDAVAPAANVWISGAQKLAAPGCVNAIASTSDVHRIVGLCVLPGIQAPTAAQSPYIMRSYEQELELCKRYWQKVIVGGQWNIAAGQYWSSTHTLSPSMRTTPTVTRISDYFLNGFGVPFSERITPEGFMATALSSAAGSAGFHTWFACDARL